MSALEELLSELREVCAGLEDKRQGQAYRYTMADMGDGNDSFHQFTHGLGLGEQALFDRLGEPLKNPCSRYVVGNRFLWLWGRPNSSAMSRQFPHLLNNLSEIFLQRANF
jgi:hypothetical protein